MNSESMADMLRAAMEQRQGGKNSFTMTGQYAGSVEKDGDREYVMYESPNGEQIKVYGNWNEYAVSRDEQGRDMIADEDYPIVQNEEGEYVLDEVRHNENMDTAYEREPVERMARETEMESTQGSSKIENLLEKLRDARGPRRLPGRFQEGGKLPGDKVSKMKKSIIRMLEGGASDKEINAAIEKSGLGSSYDFDWDNVQMTVTAKPKDGERFGPKDEGGQRGDMFAYGGKMKYNQGGSMNPKPPTWITNDPNFQYIQYRGKAKGEPDSDFRYDLKGVKFYGWDDDGLEFIDQEGNRFSAERTIFKGDRSDSAQRDDESRYHDMFDYLQSMGARGSDEFEVKAHGARGGFRPERAQELLQNLQKMPGSFEKGGKISRLNSLLDASQGTISAGEGRRIEQDDFFNVRVDGEGFTYFIGDDGDDAYVKTPNGQYMRFQRDELIQAIGDQSDMLIRRQEGQRVGGVPMGGPFSGRYGGQGASKTEDLLQRLRDVNRRRR